MARFEFRLPDIGEGVAEAEIVAWHAAVGDAVEEGQLIASVMTDKATVEMEAPVSGTIVERAGEPGDRLAIGSVLVAIETEGDAPVEEAPAPLPERRREPRIETAPPEAEGPQPAAALPEDSAHSPQEDRQVLASPAVRRRAKALGVDLAQVPAPDGQVHHADLDHYLFGTGGVSAKQAVPRPDRQIPVRGVRRQIARRMEEAKRHIPHFSYVEEMDVTALERLRATLNAHHPERPVLHLLPFLITAICRALPDSPMLNAHYDDREGMVTEFGAVHLGLATQTDAGLMVPVIRDVQRLNLWQLAATIAELAEGARAGKLAAEELRGSTISVTSLGKLGGIAATPIINRPEVAILAPNRIVERPVWIDGRAEPRKLMNLSISCDHRIVDGHDAASFVQAVKRMLEEPALLFLGD